MASLRVRDLRDGNGDRGASSVYWLHEEILDDSVTLRLVGMSSLFDLGRFLGTFISKLVHAYSLEWHFVPNVF